MREELYMLLGELVVSILKDISVPVIAAALTVIVTNRINRRTKKNKRH